MRLIMKSKQVKNPGSRGGRYWIDRKGKVRYDVRGVSRPRGIDMANKMFTDNIRYFVGMAKNIAAKFGIAPEYYDGQPVGSFADILSEGKLAAIRAHEDYFKRGYQKHDLMTVVKKRASGAMNAVAAKLKSSMSLSYHDTRRLREINRYRDKFYAKKGHYPDIEEIVENISIKHPVSGKEYSKDEKIDIVERLKDVSVKHDGLVDVDNDIASKQDDPLPFSEKEIHETITRLYQRGRITKKTYTILSMFLGTGKYKKARANFSQIGRELGVTRAAVNNQIKRNADVLKPVLERYMDDLRGINKSLAGDELKQRIRVLLEVMR